MHVLTSMVVLVFMTVLDKFFMENVLCSIVVFLLKPIIKVLHASHNMWSKDTVLIQCIFIFSFVCKFKMLMINLSISWLMN